MQRPVTPRAVASSTVVSDFAHDRRWIAPQPTRNRANRLTLRGTDHDLFTLIGGQSRSYPSSRLTQSRIHATKPAEPPDATSSRHADCNPCILGEPSRSNQLPELTL